MFEKIKKYRSVLLAVFVISVGVNAFLLVNSSTLEEIIRNLEEVNEDLDKKLKESTVRETAFLNEIRTKTAVIAGLDNRLTASRQSVDRLKNEVAALKQPEDPQTFRDLDRYYKRRLVKRGIVKYIVGAAVGVGAGYFLFKKR
jgi:hypothetical protein